MTDVEREESESGKFSLWVHLKNWVSDYLKPADLNRDGNKNVGVNVQNQPSDYPSATISGQIETCYYELHKKPDLVDFNIDGNKNLGVNVQNEPTLKAKGSTDGGTNWVPLKVDADGKVICTT